MDTPELSTDLVTRHVVGQVINAISAGDWGALMLCVSPDLIYWRPGTNDRVDGAAEYVAQWQRLVEGTSNLRYRPHTVVVDGDTAMVEATAEWVDTDGQTSRYSLVTVMRIAGGQLVEEREYIVPDTRGS